MLKTTYSNLFYILCSCHSDSCWFSSHQNISPDEVRRNFLIERKSRQYRKYQIYWFQINVNQGLGLWNVNRDKNIVSLLPQLRLQMRVCAFFIDDLVKILSQTSQVNVCSPVCSRMCNFVVNDDLKTLLQIGQTNGSSLM